MAGQSTPVIVCCNSSSVTRERSLTLSVSSCSGGAEFSVNEPTVSSTRCFLAGVVRQAIEPVRDPVTYCESPHAARTCGCGCGAPVTLGWFLTGHDQKALCDRVAKVGTVQSAGWRTAPAFTVSTRMR